MQSRKEKEICFTIERYLLVVGFIFFFYIINNGQEITVKTFMVNFYVTVASERVVFCCLVFVGFLFKEP